jgi:hypothetical protein
LPKKPKKSKSQTFPKKPKKDLKGLPRLKISPNFLTLSNGFLRNKNNKTTKQKLNPPPSPSIKNSRVKIVQFINNNKNDQHGFKELQKIQRPGSVTHEKSGIIVFYDTLRRVLTTQ